MATCPTLRLDTSSSSNTPRVRVVLDELLEDIVKDGNLVTSSGLLEDVLGEGVHDRHDPKHCTANAAIPSVSCICRFCRSLCFSWELENRSLRQGGGHASGLMQL
uniref:Uncharacterized protein n=1 Tax=Oryza brachyantha TaxID=4533 RepID=J3KUB6_ORYBR